MEGTVEGKMEMEDVSGISHRYVFTLTDVEVFANDKILDDYLQVKTCQRTLCTTNGIPKTTGRRYVASKP